MENPFEQIIKRLDAIEQIVNGLKVDRSEMQTAEKNKEYLTRRQVADMLDVDLSTVHNWCKSGKLNPLSLGSRIYFLRSELDAAFTPQNN